VSGFQRFIQWSALVVVVSIAACGGAAEPNPLADGIAVYARVCAACHGNAGQGGVGPALAAVVEDFPSCDDHIEWVTLGSDGWTAAHGDTYGATVKPVRGGMPGFARTLSAEEIAAVAAYERHRHGGADLEVVLEDCGVGRRWRAPPIPPVSALWAPPFLSPPTGGST
jgi:cytochrome c553